MKDNFDKISLKTTQFSIYLTTDSFKESKLIFGGADPNFIASDKDEGDIFWADMYKGNM